MVYIDARHKQVREAARKNEVDNAQDYANTCAYEGKVLVATVTHSRYKDTFYGQ